MARARTQPVLWARRKLSRLPRAIRIALAIAILLPLLVLTNLAYHVIRKPSELLFFVGRRLDKEPSRRGGNTDRCSAPIPPARSRPNCWPRWRRSKVPAIRWPAPTGAGDRAFNPFAIYKPASSAVGLYQMLDAAAAEAARTVSEGTRSPIPVAGSSASISARSRAMPPNSRPCIWITMWRGFWLARRRRGKPAAEAGSRRIHPSLRRGSRLGLRAP